MKICVFNPQSEFSKDQQKQLSQLGKVVYTKTREQLPIEQLLKLVKNADVLAVGIDVIGGFERGRETLINIIESLPNLKGIAVDTTDTQWIDLDLCRKRKIVISNIPISIYRETVAEHTIALLLCVAKRVIITDRRTQKRKYRLVKGFEVKNKTLGVIGLGNIGSRVAEMARCFGMKVIAYNRSPKKLRDVEMKSIEKVLNESDVISLHTTYEEENKGMISEEEIEKMKKGVVIVNTADRSLVDERAMADAIKNGKVDSYVYEAEDLENTPLAKVENAIGLKGFGWYTKEALDKAFEVWVDNIVTIVKNRPQNRVV